MASAVELATAYVTIAASGDDLAPTFGRSFRAVEKVAGDSGKRMGKALTGQLAKATGADVDKARAAYEQASKKVTATAESQAAKVEAARRKEEIAQAKVTEALSKYPAESSQVLAAQDRLALASQKVEAAQRAQQSAMDRANRELDETSRSLRETEKAAEKAATPFERLGDRLHSAFRGDFKGAFKPVEREGENAAEEIEKDFRRSGDDSAKGFSSTFKSGLAGFAGGIVATIGFDKLKQVGGAIWEIGESFDHMYDTIRVGTGATGEALAGLEDSAQAVASNVPADFDRVGSTVADLNTRLGLSGDTLETVASQYLYASDILGEELDIQETSAAFSAFKLEGDQVAGAMDTLFQVSQATGVSMNDLAGSIQKNAPALQNLGFGFEETAAMVGVLDKAGLDADQVMNSMSRSLVNLAKDGEEPAEAFDRVTGEIQRMVDTGDIAGATDLASKVFGTRGAPQFVGALQSGKLNLDQLRESVGATGDTLIGLGEETADFPQKWQLFKNKALIALEPIGDALFSLGGEAMGALADWVETIDFTPLAEGIDAVVEGGKAIWDILVNGDFDGGLFGLEEDSGVVDTLFKLRDAAIWLWEKALEPLGQWIADHGKDIAAFLAGFGGTVVIAGLIALGGAIGGLIASISWIPLAIGAAVGALTWFFTQTEVGKKIFASVVDWIVGTAWPAIKTFAGWVATAAVWLWQNVLVPAWNGIRTAIAATVDWIVGTAWPVIKAVWDGIATAAVWLWQNVLVPAWNGIRTAIAATVEWVTGTMWPALQATWNAIAGTATWLWQSIIQPVWTGIKTAIAIAVAVVMTYIDLLTWYFEHVIAPVAMWLWNNILAPAWAGIQAAIGAVVDWFQTTAWPALKAAWDAVAAAATWLWQNVLQPAWAGIQAAISAVVAWFQTVAWPIIQTVIGYIRTGFDLLKTGLQVIWGFIRDNVIAPVVDWLMGTAWPIVQTVLGYISTGFGVMRDALRTVWDEIRDRIIQPVVTWFESTIQPAITTVTDKIEQSFTTMKDGIAKAWDAVKTAARTPVDFVINKVYNEGLKKNFNDVAAKMGLPESARLPDMSLPAGFDRGGILPGQSSWRDGDDQVVTMRRGEGVYVSEALRDPIERARLFAANRWAMAGRSMSEFRERFPAFDKGGILDWVKDTSGDTIDWIRDKGGFIADAIADPKGAITRLVDTLTGSIPGAGMVRDLAVAVPKKVAGALADKLLGFTTGPEGDVPAGGSGGSLSKTLTLAQSMGLSLTSSGRRGARTAQNGLVSLHALGRAHDYAGSSGAMMAFFNAVDRLYSPTELLYTPAYGRNIHRSGRRYANTGKTATNHWDHVHVGFDQGGIFDTGGVLDSGAFALNLSGQPEVVLNPDESRAYMAGRASTGPGAAPAVVGLSDEDRALLRAIAEAVDLKVDNRSVVRSVTRAFDSERMPLITATGGSHR
ncbi:phage tail tape measure protein [Brachybacterium phenoliresistens]|uniref:phage tail tape measure protein n=1 Tax=Brachybacterium phenoliresistens TaxID=396014 RepID=UPI0031DE0D44